MSAPVGRCVASWERGRVRIAPWQFESGFGPIFGVPKSGQEKAFGALLRHWPLASCTLYFACEMIAIIGTAILTPVTFGLNNTPEITAFLFSEVLCGETISLTPASVILYALIFPFVTLTAVCMLQTLLNLVVRPAISFLICFVTYIAAAYFPIEWLVGNGAMVMRYQLFDANGLSYRKELVFTLLLLLLSIGAGYLLIQRKDLISLEK